MVKLSRRALFNLALYIPATLAAAVSVALLALSLYTPAIIAAGIAAGWLIIGAALALLFEPALLLLLSEE